MRRGSGRLLAAAAATASLLSAPLPLGVAWSPLLAPLAGALAGRRPGRRLGCRGLQPRATGAGVLRIRGCQSRKYLRAMDGHLLHDNEPSEEHLFVLVPGTGPRTGAVRLHHLQSDSCIFMTKAGHLGSFQGDFEDHYWDLVGDHDDSFALQSHNSDLRLYSNSDGRLGSYFGEVFDDQLFQCEDRHGSVVRLEPLNGCHGLQDTGFEWSGGGEEPTVYTDAFHVGHYVFDPGSKQLCELRELTRLQISPSWGSARSLQLHEMEQPHQWAIEEIPLLRRLQEAGLIAADNPLNVVYRAHDARGLEYRGIGLPPSSAIKFALRPVSGGRRVPFQRTWLRAWHGAPTHAVEAIAREGLRCGKKITGQKNNIYLSPSFQYTFCLYSAPDILVGDERLRLVFEVRVKPGSFEEHGDHYKFCITQLIEQSVPADCLEWELKDNPGTVQVVGLVLKQLGPHHPTLKHDTIVRHACKALMRE